MGDRLIWAVGGFACGFLFAAAVLQSVGKTAIITRRLNPMARSKLGGAAVNALKKRWFVPEHGTNVALLGDKQTYPARPIEGDVDFDSLRKSVTDQISTSLRYLAK
jgi:hypothetical protein